MSTIASTERLDARQVSGKGLSFLTLLQVELRKQVDTRGGRGLLIAIAAITALVIVATMYFSRHDGASFSAFVLATGTPLGLLIPALGVLTACNEWSQRTALITFTQEPRRARVLIAKTLAATIWASAFLFMAWALAAICHLATAAISGKPTDWDMNATELFGNWVNTMTSVLMGVGFGMLLLITPLALVAYYIGPNLITGLLMIAKWSREHVVPWLSATSIPLGEQPTFEGMPPTTNPWGKWAVSMLVWIVLPYVVGFIRVMRREVK